MNLIKPFETKRLKFRLLTQDDVNVICRQFSDQDMCKYFSDPPCDIEEAKYIIDHYKNPIGSDHLRYGMFDKITNEFIGTIGYHFWDREQKQVEIGYDVWKEYWNQGYISEALPELFKICFDHLQVNTIYVLVHPENKASIASVKKFGFEESKPCRNADDENQICLKLIKSIF